MNKAEVRVSMKAEHRKPVAFILLVGLIFAVSSWWRSSALGFYSDDWIFLSNTIHSPGTLADYLKVNWYARPVYAVIAWALNLLASGSPVYWQVISSATVLTSAVVSCKIIAYTAGRLGYGPRASLLGGIYGAAVLFFSPWMLAVFVWSTGVLTLWSFILFGIGYLLIEQSEGLKRKCAGSFLVLAGFLTYEAYWFAFIPLLIISRSASPSQVVSNIRSALWYIGPFCLAVIYQRILVPSIVPGPSKLISPNFSLILNNIGNLDRFISQGIDPIPTVAFYITLMALVVLLLATKAITFLKFVRVVAALGLGVLFTAVMHGAAGYGLTGTGVMSRTMAAPGFYFAVLVGVLATATVGSLDTKSRMPRFSYAGMPLIGILFVLMLCGFVAQMSAWTSWKEQSKRVLDTLRVVVDPTHLGNHMKDIAVVVQIDGDPNGEIFGASWEMSGAVALTAPSLVPATGVWFLTARQGAWGTVWDGKSVVQTVCSAPPENVVERHSSNAPPLYYRIDPRDGKLIESGRLVKDIQFGCDGVSPKLVKF